MKFSEIIKINKEMLKSNKDWRLELELEKNKIKNPEREGTEE